eukprot:5791244-Alexandrium_andersonii.AAC.1
MSHPRSLPRTLIVDVRLRGLGRVFGWPACVHGASAFTGQLLNAGITRCMHERWCPRDLD